MLEERRNFEYYYDILLVGRVHGGIYLFDCNFLIAVLLFCLKNGLVFIKSAETIP